MKQESSELKWSELYASYLDDQKRKRIDPFTEKADEVTLWQEIEEAAEINQQGFNSEYAMRDLQADSLFPIILSWALILPPSNNGVLDVAGGQGIEAYFLEQHGITCTPIDASPALVKKSYLPEKARLGVVSDLTEYENGSFGGVLNKDAWVFLSPKNRKMALLEALRVLGPLGKLLIISEKLSAHKLIYTPKGSTYTQKIQSTDVELGTEKKWLQAVSKEIAAGSRLEAIHFKTLPHEVAVEVTEAGFEVEKLSYYNATDNRWINRDGFVLEAKK